MSKKKSASLTQLALQKFKKNFWGVFSFGFICLSGLVALFAYLVAPDSSKNANQMHLSIHSKPPGFQAQILSIPSTNIKEQSFLDRVFFW
jgi:peptide/nickel transport system permease protein